MFFAFTYVDDCVSQPRVRAGRQAEAVYGRLSIYPFIPPATHLLGRRAHVLGVLVVEDEADDGRGAELPVLPYLCGFFFHICVSIISESSLRCFRPLSCGCGCQVKHDLEVSQEWGEQERVDDR